MQTGLNHAETVIVVEDKGFQCVIWANASINKAEDGAFRDFTAGDGWQS